MSDTTSTTPDSGSAELTVNDAASAFLGLMGGDDGADEGQPEAQAAPEEAEAQGDEESYEDESEADEQDDGEGVEQPKYRVKAAGEEREVTLDELIKSYQLGQDYTKILGLMGGDDGADEGQPEAQAAPEEAEAQGDEESYEDESEADEQDDGEGVEQPKYRVKAAGEEREVTLDELIKSYQLGQDYTKKSQMVAEERKVIEAEKTAVAEAKQLRDQYAQRLQMMEQVLSQQMPQEDLESLKDTDPIGYAVKVAEMSQREKQLQAVQAERARIAEQQEADRIGQLQQVVSEESKKLAEAIPDLTDPDKGQAIKRDIREFGKKLGFSDAELANVYDSRAVLTLYKAMQYDRLMASKPQVTKKVQEAPRVLKAGTATTRSDGDAQVVKKLKQQARQSGRVADAAALFERML